MKNQSLEKFFENFTHHANLVVGNCDLNYLNLNLLVDKQISTGKIQSADVWSRVYETISIEDARDLKELDVTKPNGERRIVLLSLFSIQNEAQNSLLKLFEEPSANTTFIVCARSPEIFLPTVLSRFNVIYSDFEPKPGTSGTSKGSKSEISIDTFLSSTFDKRLHLIEPIIKEKDKNLAETFLNGLETALSKDTLKITKINPTIFEDIFSARRFLRSRSPSVKMILENLCGIVPIV